MPRVSYKHNNYVLQTVGVAEEKEEDEEEKESRRGEAGQAESTSFLKHLVVGGHHCDDGDEHSADDQGDRSHRCPCRFGLGLGQAKGQKATSGWVAAGRSTSAHHEQIDDGVRNNHQST